jgi:hypothetical protein
MRMIFGAIGGMNIGRGNRSTRRKPTPAPLCPPQNPTWYTGSRTPDRSGGKPATNRLSYGAAFFSPISSPLTTRRVTVEVFDPASTRVNPKIHYRVHKSPPPVPILSQINPIHTSPSYLPQVILILSTHLRLRLPSGLFPSVVPTNILHALIFSPE